MSPATIRGYADDTLILHASDREAGTRMLAVGAWGFAFGRPVVPESEWPRDAKLYHWGTRTSGALVLLSGPDPRELTR